MNVRWMMMAGLLTGALWACDDPSLNPSAPGEEPHEVDGEQANRPGVANPPFQQNEESDDLQTTAAVRRAVLDAEDLGAGADNLVITTQGGVVTLRGNVASQAEKTRVEEIVRGVPGVERVTSEIMIAASDEGADGEGANERAPDYGADGAQTPNPR